MAWGVTDPLEKAKQEELLKSSLEIVPGFSDSVQELKTTQDQQTETISKQTETISKQATTITGLQTDLTVSNKQVNFLTQKVYTGALQSNISSMNTVNLTVNQNLALVSFYLIDDSAGNNTSATLMLSFSGYGSFPFRQLTKSLTTSLGVRLTFTISYSNKVCTLRVTQSTTNTQPVYYAVMNWGDNL